MGKPPKKEKTKPVLSPAQIAHLESVKHDLESFSCAYGEQARLRTPVSLDVAEIEGFSEFFRNLANRISAVLSEDEARALGTQCLPGSNVIFLNVLAGGNDDGGSAA